MPFMERLINAATSFAIKLFKQLREKNLRFTRPCLVFTRADVRFRLSGILMGKFLNPFWDGIPQLNVMGNRKSNVQYNVTGIVATSGL